MCTTKTRAKCAVKRREWTARCISSAGWIKREVCTHHSGQGWIKCGAGRALPANIPQLSPYIPLAHPYHAGTANTWVPQRYPSIDCPPPPSPSPNMRNRQPKAEMSTAMWGIWAMPCHAMPAGMCLTINGVIQGSNPAWSGHCWGLPSAKPGLQKDQNKQFIEKMFFRVWSILGQNCPHGTKVFYLAEQWWDTVVNRASANLPDKKHV